ncbi:MAG: hypothetical protein QGG40_13055, partial [Myxococcota bacterium]|nr:hypothetical protein [Myxococcota bacterium]
RTGTALRAADLVISQAIRRLRSRTPPPVRTEVVEFRSTVGYRIHAHVHVPVGASPREPLPAVVLCPGIDDPGSVFDRWSSPVTADEIARLGCLVMHFDPAGRGESWGEEDFGGIEHQDEVRSAITYLGGRPDVDGRRIGLVSISLGVSMALGAAADADAKVAWVLDWEGPSDREIITAGGTIMTPADGHRMDDEAYWQPREAVRFVGSLRCPYIRLQSIEDHAQPGETRHAMRMIEAAAGGDLPWFQLNDHPRGEIPRRAHWTSPGRLSAHHSIVRKIRLLLALPPLNGSAL